MPLAIRHQAARVEGALVDHHVVRPGEFGVQQVVDKQQHVGGAARVEHLAAERHGGLAVVASLQAAEALTRTKTKTVFRRRMSPFNLWETAASCTTCYPQ